MRYIPVHMGQICVVLSLSERAKVHPRVYGADQCWNACGPHEWGSSPCVRGRLFSRRARLKGVRFIPVRTGADSLTTVHPVPSMGSSPCTRGRCDQRSGQAIVLRFIPVYTGRIITLCTKKSKIWAHPRVYGADRFSWHDILNVIGSSPCIRGRY